MSGVRYWGAMSEGLEGFIPRPFIAESAHAQPAPL